MIANLTLLALVYLFATIIGTITSTILWFFPRDGRKPRKILSTIFIVLTFNMSMGFILESEIIYRLPGFYKTGTILCFLFMPLAYLYVRAIVERKMPGKKDLVHFIPIVLLALNSLPFLSLSFDEKVLLMESELAGEIMVSSGSSIFSEEIMLFSYHIAFCIYWLLQVWLLFKLFKYGDEDIKAKNAQAISWLFFFISIQFFFFYPYFIVSSAPGDLVFYQNIGKISGSMVLFLFAAYLFMKPELLYGINKITVLAPEVNNKEMIKSLKPKTAPKYLSKSKIIEINEKLGEHIENNSPYLNHNYNLKRMADDLDVPLYILSSFINKEKGMNFNDFLNQYRINYCKQKIEEGEWKHITLEGLAYDCGFNNRNSFTTAFKKFAGKTPSEFINEYK